MKVTYVNGRFELAFEPPTGRVTAADAAQVKAAIDHHYRPRGSPASHRQNSHRNCPLCARRRARAHAEGGLPGRTGPRPRNPATLGDRVYALLRRGPKSIPELTAGLLRLGHRSSGDFRRVLTQTLLADPRFVRAGRGVYRRRGPD